MVRSKSVQLKLIRNIAQLAELNLSEQFYRRFNDKEGFGFVGTGIEDTQITSTLVFQTVNKQKIFIPDSNSIEEVDRNMFNYVPFELNISNGLIKAENAGFKINKLLSVIGLLIKNRSSIDDLHVDFRILLNYLQSKSYSYNIAHVTVANYQPRVGLSGRFEAGVFDYDVAVQTIHQYGLDIKDIELYLIEDEFEMKCRITSLGSLTVRTDEDYVSEGLDLLSQIVLEITNA